MSEKESSEEMASVAGRVMSMARNGGPVKHFEEELRKEFALGEGDSAVLDKIGRIFQPYFDDAESLAGSVMSQREPG
jgi:hypothetical protein